MPALDTNILVRLLVEDDPRQMAAALNLVERAAREARALFVPLTVALELEWVLRSRYRFPKDVVLTTFSALLETQELEFQDEAAMETALYLYRQQQADFAECLHLGCALAHGSAPLITFDQSAARLAGAQLLES
ncbi:MAG TPA: type II toxin-antitoxin system VapC family toxin [Burkholderiales bacterium]|nr:type II toxin-antitoxin system VapC family toxin [Burkholderiales bacterium]